MGERRHLRPSFSTSYLRPGSDDYLQGDQRKRGGGREIPRLFRFLRLVTPLPVPPYSGCPPGRIGRNIAGIDCPRRGEVYRPVGTPFREERQRVVLPGGRRGGGCI